MTNSTHNALTAKALAVRAQVVERHLKGDLNYDRDLTALAHEIITMSRLDETFAVGQLFNAMGVIEFDRGHFIAAYDYTMSALHCFEEIRNDERIVSALNNLGEIHRLWGKHAAALDYYRRANQIAQALEDWTLVALLASNIGLVYLEQNQPQKALEQFTQSLEISSNITPRPEAESETYSAMASAYLALGEQDLAWNAAQHALTISQEYNRSRDIARAYRTLGTLAAAHPERNVAPERYFTQSRDLYAANGARADMARTDLAEAEWRISTGELERAEKLLQGAHQTFMALKMAEETARTRLLLEQFHART